MTGRYWGRPAAQWMSAIATVKPMLASSKCSGGRMIVGESTRHDTWGTHNSALLFGCQQISAEKPDEFALNGAMSFRPGHHRYRLPVHKLPAAAGDKVRASSPELIDGHVRRHIFTMGGHDRNPIPLQPGAPRLGSLARTRYQPR
jgi:hypothetical protein